MGSNAQKRAIKSYRERLTEKDMGRIEIVCLNSDRDLIRALARYFIESDTAADAERLRMYIDQVTGKKGKGRILKSFLNSPLRDSGIELKRSRETGRKVVL